MPKVLILSLGGTIAMTGDGGKGVRPTLDAESLVAAIPGLVDEAIISAESFRQLPGAHLGVGDIIALAERVAAAVAESADGVVITQGTDTIEETAYLLDLLLDVQAPVIVTGAMRNPTLPGADGPANLLASVQVAASHTARGLGVLVVFGDEVHAARHVRKTHTSSPMAFASVPGPLGWVSEGRTTIAFQPRGSSPTIVPAMSDGDVALVTAAIDDDARILRELPGLGFAGVVVEALGGGHVPMVVAEAIGELAAEMPVVFTSRTGRGEILTHTYDFPGSERDLIERGALAGGSLDGPKARALLTLLLRTGIPPGEVVERFNEFVSQSDLARSATAGADHGF